MLGGDPAYDGQFYKDRSPINVIKQVKVPTFLVSGEYDLFQRGTPLLFEKLQKQGVPVRMITGPWDHLEGSSGAEVGQAGYGPLQELWLRWFDHYVKGKKDQTLLTDIKPFTYYEQGTGSGCATKQVRRQGPARDVLPALRRRSFGGRNGGCVGHGDGRARRRCRAPGHRAVHPLGQPVDRRHHHAVWPDNPCLRDNQVNDLGGLSFQTRTAAKAAAAPGTDQRAALRLARRAATGCSRSRSRTWPRTARSPG